MLLISDITTKTQHHVSPLMFNRLDQIEHHNMRTPLIETDGKRSKTTLNMYNIGTRLPKR